jgi:hypothetical protein
MPASVLYLMSYTKIDIVMGKIYIVIQVLFIVIQYKHFTSKYPEEPPSKPTIHIRKDGIRGLISRENEI